MSLRRVASTVLTFEAIVIFLAIPVAIAISDVDAELAVPTGLGVALLALVAAALLRKPIGWWLGWLVQALAVAMGFVVPAMFVLGGLFALLWFFTLRVGKQVEAAQRAQQEH